MRSALRSGASFIYIGVGVVKGRASSALAQERAKGEVTQCVIPREHSDRGNLIQRHQPKIATGLKDFAMTATNHDIPREHSDRGNLIQLHQPKIATGQKSTAITSVKLVHFFWSKGWSF